ncbi:MAG: hypothetical protein GX250_03865 [Clostridiales bacterium]|nr:hypothetical protein [Clostridiales bacterium]
MLRERINRIFTSKTFYVVFSIIAAILLWFYVSSVENKDDDVTISNIPVTFIGQEDLFTTRSLVVNDNREYTVTLRLMGKRNTVSKLSKSNIAINVDISDIKTSGTYNRLFSVVLPSDINTADVYILSRTPEYITVEIDKYITRSIAIEGVFDGSVRDGYMAEPLVFEPEFITVGGSEDIVSLIDHAWVVMERDDIAETITQSLGYVFVDENGDEIPLEGLDVDSPKVTVTLPIVMVKDVELTVRLVPGGGATEKDVELNISPAIITLSGDAAVLEGLNEIVLDIYDLSVLTGRISKTYNIPIPNGLTNLSGETEAMVNASITGLYTKKLTVSNIKLANVSSGYKATAVTQVIEITIRGPWDAVDSVKPSDITVTADLSDLGQTTGRYSVAADISISGNKNVGAVGTYNVVVTLGT